MIYDERYYYYDKKKDKVIQCTWDEYVKVDPKIKGKIKSDKFVLGSGLKKYKISTICLIKDHGVFENSRTPLIFETMIFSDDKEYDLYQERYTCLEEAKRSHDEIILKIIRGIKVNE